ncbi:MAG: GDP-mannose 4,6-dehydratase [Candidatus Omnitrophica bacterium]|nr:GDP-mannose 4,6-dehydratase [Candidatus Omnitrophota bacterium]MDE2223232.1 GDP-mannose 4,6-dehydratase [Candidatus Omnitrophota bacterium]
MKKILITGAGGFIGSHLTELCVRRGFQVRAFVRYNANNRWGWLDASPALKKIDVVAGDIRDFDSVFKAMKGCDTVFHLAALVGIPYSYISPLAYVKTNIEGTYNVLEAVKDLGVKNVLVTSTSETYGTAQYVPIDEKHLSVGQSPYAATKIAADQLALSYWRSFGLPVKVVRPFNTYGPRQSARAVVPTIMTQVLSGQRQIKLGNTSPTRDLTYVADTVEGFLQIARCPRTVGEAINIGMNTETSIGELARMIAALAKVKIRVVEDRQRLRGRSTEVERLRCNNAKLLGLTGWKPRYTLEAGLKETMDWIGRNLGVYKTGLYNV